MSDVSNPISSLVSILNRINQTLDEGTDLDYYLNYVNKTRSMEVLITLNISAEPDLRRANNFIELYNKSLDKKIKFERKHSFFRGSKVTREAPIFYLDEVPLTENDVSSAVYELVDAVNKFYDSL